jgi:hypothetical protein
MATKNSTTKSTYIGKVYFFLQLLGQTTCNIPFVGNHLMAGANGSSRIGYGKTARSQRKSYPDFTHIGSL